MKIQGKIAVVSGASRGIGAATAIALAKKKAKVILLARSQKDLDSIKNQIIQLGGEAVTFSVDLSEWQAIVRVCTKINDEVGAPDILVNNAGLGRWLAAEETGHEDAEMMTKLPYLAAFHLSREFIPGMLKRESGYVLTVNSPASLIVIPGASTYSAARWALRGFTESLKIDLRKTGIKVCHCVFGEVSSNYFQANPESMERIPGIASKTMRPLTPEQAANIIVTAIEKNKSEVTAPFMMAFYRVCLAVAPWSVKALVKASGWKRN